MKQKIIDRIKFLKNNWRSLTAFLILTFLMTLGYLTLYAMIWLKLGLPATDITMAILAVLAFVSELAFLKWVTTW